METPSNNISTNNTPNTFIYLPNDLKLPGIKPDSILVTVSSDNMDIGTHKGIYKGNQVFASKTTFDRLIIGRDYVIIDSADNVLINRITAADLSNRNFVLSNLNQAYPDRSIYFSDVKEMYDIYMVQTEHYSWQLDKC